MKNREKVFENLRSKKEWLNNIEKDLLEGRDLASTLTALNFDLFFCRGCGDDEADVGNCEKCAKEWMEEEENDQQGSPFN